MYSHANRHDVSLETHYACSSITFILRLVRSKSFVQALLFGKWCTAINAPFLRLPKPISCVCYSTQISKKVCLYDNWVHLFMWLRGQGGSIKNIQPDIRWKVLLIPTALDLSVPYLLCIQIVSGAVLRLNSTREWKKYIRIINNIIAKKFLYHLIEYYRQRRHAFNEFTPVLIAGYPVLHQANALRLKSVFTIFTFIWI